MTNNKIIYFYNPGNSNLKGIFDKIVNTSVIAISFFCPVVEYLSNNLYFKSKFLPTPLKVRNVFRNFLVDRRKGVKGHCN